MVEIAKALSHNAKVIIMDEPTATLTPREVQHLFLLFPARYMTAESMVAVLPI